MTLQSNEFWLIVMLALLGVLAGFGLFARWCSFSPAVRRAQMEKLCVGMTTSEVVALVGQPRVVKKSAEGVSQWIYGAPMKRHVLMMQFNRRDKLQSFAHGIPGQGRRTPFPHDSSHEA